MFLFPYFCHEDLAQIRTILSEKSIGSGTGATNDVVVDKWAMGGVAALRGVSFRERLKCRALQVCLLTFHTIM